MNVLISRRRRAAALCSTAIGASLAMGPALAQSSDAARIAALEAQVQALTGQVQALSGGQVVDTGPGALRTDAVAAAISPGQTIQAPPRQGIEGHPFFGDLPDGRTTNVLATGNDKVRLTFSGQINRALNFIDDGNESNVYQVDNENASSRFRFLGETTPLLDTQAVSLFEFEWPYNGSLDVNQIDQSVASQINQDLNLRLLEVGFSNLTWGSVFIGQGWMASDGTAEIDISGVYNAGWTGHTFAFGGMLPTTDEGFVPRNPAAEPQRDQYPDTPEGQEEFEQARDAFDSDSSNFVNVFSLGNDLDGFSRLVRVRYNSPAFAGFQVSASTATESRYDVALRYAGAWDWGRMAAGISYWTDTRDSGFEAWTGSASMILTAEDRWWDGLSFTLSGAQQDFKERDNSPTMYYGKVAYTTSALTDWGRTGFLIQYGNYSDFRVEDETFDMYGIGVSQNIDQLGAEVYASFNQAQFDNPDIDYNNMNFFQFGTMVRF